MASTDPLAPVETLVLRQGPVSLAALKFLWKLEEDQFRISLDADQQLRIAPKSRITPALDAAIREHRDELVMLVQWNDAIQ